MKRNTYRDHSKHQTLSDAHKKAIFSKIMKEIVATPDTQQTLLHRRSQYVRPVARISGVFVLGLTVFMAAYIVQRPDNTTLLDTNATIRSLDADTTSIAQASPVGRVIQTQGLLRIGDQDQSDLDIDIMFGQIIVLEDDAEIVFAIDESVQARVVGPARFTLEQYDDTTTLLNLIQGTYAEVKTLQDIQETDQPDTPIQDQPQPVRELIVKTPTIEVAPLAQNAIDLVIDETDADQAVVTNEGSSIIVRNLATTEAIAIDTNQTGVWDFTANLVAIQEDQSQISSIDDNDEKQLLAIRYEADEDQASALDTLQTLSDTPQVESGVVASVDEIGVDTSELLALVQDSMGDEADDLTSPVDTDQNLSDSSDTSLAGRVLDPQRMNTLQQTLGQSYRTLTQQYDPSSDEDQTEVLQSLVDATNTALSAFNASGPATASPENLIGLVTKLRNILTDEYFIPPSLIQPLTTLLGVLK